MNVVGAYSDARPDANESRPRRMNKLMTVNARSLSMDQKEACCG